MPAPVAVPASAPVRLQVMPVGLDVEVRELPAERSDPINPPTMLEAYWDPAFGRPGTDATDITVFAGHSWNRGPAAFNPLLRNGGVEAAVAAGSEVLVTTGAGVLRYVVTDVQLYRKGTLASAPFWDRMDGRVVVLITCRYNDLGVSRENLVVIARMQ